MDQSPISQFMIYDELTVRQIGITTIGTFHHIVLHQRLFREPFPRLKPSIHS